MREFNYYERDYAFGQTILTLRTRIGITQAELARLLGVSRKAIGDWERGSSYPNVKHLKQFIGLAIEYRAFPPGQVVEEARALWENAHQKVLFDETWLAALLPAAEVSLHLPAVKGVSFSAALPHRVDWGEAPVVSTLYGRERELELLARWATDERCQVISVLGFGGVGKSALAVSLMVLLEELFDVVIWRSLRNFPTWEDFIVDILQALAPAEIHEEATNPEKNRGLLLKLMQETRILLVLDNLEVLLDEGEVSGAMRVEFEGFDRFLGLCAEIEHQSCVLLTSREEPVVLAPFEGSQAKVRSLRLSPLDVVSCNRLLSEKDLIGSASDRERLIQTYSGNPLALKIVAHTIVNLFGGEILPFLDQGQGIIGGVHNLLEEQFYRLSGTEQSLLLWLTALQEPITIDRLFDVWAEPGSHARLLEALDALYRRSLIVHGLTPHEYAPQSLIMEYLTTWIITQAAGEDQGGKLEHLIEESFIPAPVREAVRQVQERLSG